MNKKLNLKFKFDGYVTSIHHRAVQGFTLIELLVVIAIIGLLASVVLVALNGARQKSRDTKRVSDMNQMAKALELFYNDAAAYPTGTGAVGTGYTAAGGSLLSSGYLQAITSKGTFALTPTYLSNLPIAPNPPDNISGSTCDATNTNPYKYQAASDGSTYSITFCLGGNIPGGIQAGVRTLTPGGFR
jgi:prepilin-type N-terminal cleavage/methylation domain-containing protein